MKKLSAGKWDAGGCMGQQPSQSTISLQAVTVATIKNKATVVMGEVGNVSVEVMLLTNIIKYTMTSKKVT